MKKLKITCVIASVLCLVMLCTSCGTSTAKIADYLNPDYVPEELVVKQQTSVSELAGFTLNQSNSYFASRYSSSQLSGIPSAHSSS